MENRCVNEGVGDREEREESGVGVVGEREREESGVGGVERGECRGEREEESS